MFAMPKPSKRESLLAAAGRVIQRSGSSALTLDAVAAEAKVSKGGLLYHFASKEELVSALLQSMLESFDQRLSPDAFGESYIRASVAEDPEQIRVAVGLLAAIAMAPALIEPLRARYPEWDAKLLAECGDRTSALVVRLALDGLFMADLLELAPPSKAERQLLAERLLQLYRKHGDSGSRRGEHQRSDKTPAKRMSKAATPAKRTPAKAARSKRSV